MGLANRSTGQIEKQEVSYRAEADSAQDFQEFLYIVSHDLQEPLRMVVGFMDLLEKRYGDKLGKEAKEFIHYAVDGAYRMQKMIDGLLTLSRIETQGKMFARADTNKALQEAINMLHPVIEESSVELILLKLPEVYADTEQLTVLFWHLLDNAIRYCSPDRKLRIEISAEMHGADWHFKCSDNGIGIDSKHWQRVFQIFQRLHKTPENNCLGMGLPICKRIVERHGGSIWLESELNVGTRFWFTLPVREFD